MVAGVARTRVAARTWGASGTFGCSIATRSLAPSAGSAAASTAPRRPSSSPARATEAGAASERASNKARGTRATRSALFLDQDAGGNAFPDVPGAGRAAGGQLVDVPLDLLLGVGRQLVEANPHVPAVPAPEVGDLSGEVQAFTVGEGHDDVDRRAHGDPRAQRQVHRVNGLQRRPGRNADLDERAGGEALRAPSFRSGGRRFFFHGGREVNDYLTANDCPKEPR